MEIRDTKEAPQVKLGLARIDHKTKSCKTTDYSPDLSNNTGKPDPTKNHPASTQACRELYTMTRRGPHAPRNPTADRKIIIKKKPTTLVLQNATHVAVH